MTYDDLPSSKVRHVLSELEPCFLLSSDIIDRKNPYGLSAVGSVVTHQDQRVCVYISAQIWVLLVAESLCYALTQEPGLCITHEFSGYCLSCKQTWSQLFFSLDCSEVNFNPDPESVCVREFV